MPANNPFAPGHVGKPRLRIMANGVALPGVVSVEVVNNNHYRSDSFSAAFALRADAQYPLQWWGDQNSLDVTIGIGLEQSDSNVGWTTLFVGQTDDIEIDPVQGLIHLTGRDLSARLIDAKTQEAFVNQTSSEVATTLAARHGLTADVTKTATLVGDFYKTDHVVATANALTRASTEWDLLVYLAQREGFDVWVENTTLHFKPITPPNTPPWRAIWRSPNAVQPVQRANIERLGMRRSLTLARDLQVTVRSWNSRTHRAITKVVKSSQANGKRADDAPQNYVFVRPNMTDDEALKFGQARLAELTRHERVITFEAPGDLLLTARDLIQLEGTASSWDQTYYPDAITRRLSFDGGFTMSARAKNSSPVSETIVQ